MSPDVPICHPTDALIITALLTGRTYSEAAEEANVSERTVKRRMADPDFRRQVNVLASAAVASVGHQLAVGSNIGVRTLMELTSDSFAAPVRLQAARALIDFHLRHRQEVEFDERLREMESQVAESPSTAWPAA